MYIKLTLQEKLKDERTSRHMTLSELEKAPGIAKATLAKYKSDKCKSKLLSLFGKKKPKQ